MDKTFDQQNDDIIELGAVSAETKGPGFGGQDEVGHLPALGLSDD